MPTTFRAPAQWITPFCSAFFGLHTLAALYCADTHLSAFATVLKPGDYGATMMLVVAPLLVGALSQSVGILMRRAVLFSFGALLGMIVFGMAEYSCWGINRWGTGVPAYVIISGLYVSEYLRSILFSRVLERKVVVLPLEV